MKTVYTYLDVTGYISFTTNPDEEDLCKHHRYTYSKFSLGEILDHEKAEFVDASEALNTLVDGEP